MLSKLKVLNRDVIKYFAMFTMLLNHFAQIFLEPGTLLYEILTDAGYFTAVTMCYFLVEGYHYTHSKEKYGERLFLFAFISQIPFSLAFSHGAFNMLFTLFLCFLIIATMDKIASRPLRVFLCILLTLATIFCDWPLLAPVYTILFYKWRNSKKKTALAFAVAAFLFALFNLPNALYTHPPLTAVLYAFFACAGILVSGFVILFLYNGKRSEHGRVISKWFFYIFYPAHLLILAGIHFYISQ